MNPVISVIVPVYNVENYLEKCLSSICNQTKKELEILLINDGSTDNSPSICEAFAKIDPRIIVIHQSSKGVSAARNTGIKNATGEMIGFVDSDDWILPDMFENLENILKENDSDISICGYARQFEDEVTQFREANRILVLPQEDALRELFRGKIYRFALWNKLYRRHCFNNITFPEGRIHEDLAVSYKLFLNAKRIVNTPKTGYIYRYREKSILTTKFHKGRIDSYKAWDEIINTINDIYPQLMREVWMRFVWWSIDNVQTILREITDKQDANEQFARISCEVRKHFKDISKSKQLSWKVKLQLLMINYQCYISAKNKKILRG
ncbi:glycosyltransferase family 2 protein [Virgibacillus sp. W0181]|uniref:glycosyltransferase family 2 protein n=1 Tax=Virgibacillus sp. W0181 TaxID=3391581 RepID=UPI003F48791F